MTKEIVGSALNAVKEMVGLGFGVRVMEEIVEKSNSLVAVKIEKGKHEVETEVRPNCFFYPSTTNKPFPTMFYLLNQFHL